MPPPRSVSAVGVVVPIHDEQELLPSCLEAVAAALATPGTAQVPVRVALVLDDCADRSFEAAQAFLGRVSLTGLDHRASIVRIQGSKVGLARAAGVDAILSQVPAAPDSIWLATTDADSRVPARWIAHQLSRHEEGVDAWAGTVTVEDWEGRRPSVYRQYCLAYDAAEGHVHGANLGFTAAAYLAADGFAPIATGEDRALWRAMITARARAVHDPSCSVVTSARRRARAPHGFADVLNRLEEAG